MGEISSLPCCWEPCWFRPIGVARSTSGCNPVAARMPKFVGPADAVVAVRRPVRNRRRCRGRSCLRRRKRLAVATQNLRHCRPAFCESSTTRRAAFRLRRNFRSRRRSTSLSPGDAASPFFCRAAANFSRNSVVGVARRAPISPRRLAIVPRNDRRSLGPSCDPQIARRRSRLTLGFNTNHLFQGISYENVIAKSS